MLPDHGAQPVMEGQSDRNSLNDCLRLLSDLFVDSQDVVCARRSAFLRDVPSVRSVWTICICFSHEVGHSTRDFDLGEQFSIYLDSEFNGDRHEGERIRRVRRH